MSLFLAELIWLKIQNIRIIARYKNIFIFQNGHISIEAFYAVIKSNKFTFHRHKTQLAPRSGLTYTVPNSAYSLCFVLQKGSHCLFPLLVCSCLLA